MNDLHSDALVFFGATGDLAYKKIFPSLQAMVKHGNLDVPVIGVAKSGWTLDQMRARMRDSLEKHGDGLDRSAFEKLCGLLRYVDGDYQDPATFKPSERNLVPRSEPLHYLAIPPVLFGAVVEQLAKSGLRARARVSCWRNRSGPTSLRRGSSMAFCIERFRRQGFSASTIISGKRPINNMLYFRFANAFPETFWNRTHVRERADHDGGKFRCPGPGRLL